MAKYNTLEKRVERKEAKAAEKEKLLNEAKKNAKANPDNKGAQRKISRAEHKLEKANQRVERRKEKLSDKEKEREIRRLREDGKGSIYYRALVQIVDNHDNQNKAFAIFRKYGLDNKDSGRSDKEKFWKVIASYGGWQVQQHKLKGYYRLVDLDSKMRITAFALIGNKNSEFDSAINEIANMCTLQTANELEQPNYLEKEINSLITRLRSTIEPKSNDLKTEIENAYSAIREAVSNDAKINFKYEFDTAFSKKLSEEVEECIEKKRDSIDTAGMESIKSFIDDMYGYSISYIGERLKAKKKDEIKKLNKKIKDYKDKLQDQKKDCSEMKNKIDIEIDELKNSNEFFVNRLNYICNMSIINLLRDTEKAL